MLGHRVEGGQSRVGQGRRGFRSETRVADQVTSARHEDELGEASIPPQAAAHRPAGEPQAVVLSATATVATLTAPPDAMDEARRAHPLRPGAVTECDDGSGDLVSE